ncbi:MAG: hypothetical protein AB7O97_23720 [Planctomycetota bacterium]
MQLRLVGTFALVCSVLTCAPCAQDQPAPRPKLERPRGQDQGQEPRDSEQVDQQVQEMRRQMTEGRTYRSHVRVTVRLKNGNRMRGIVKDGFVVERIDGMRFVAAEASEAGAGMRLYYWNGKDNFVFLPFQDIENYRINARLTSAQLALIEREARQQEEEAERVRREANAAAAAQAAERAQKDAANPTPMGEGGESGIQPQPPMPQPGTQPGTQPGSQPVVEPAPAGGDAPAGGVGQELQQLYALLQEFPPAAGWNEAKRDEIQRRKTVIGANPSDQEKKFVERFADWQRACALFGAKPVTEPSKDGPSQDGDEDTGRRGRRRR